MIVVTPNYRAKHDIMQELIQGKALVLSGARTKRDLSRRIASQYGSFTSVGISTFESFYGMREMYRQGFQTVIVHDFPATLQAFDSLLPCIETPTRTFIRAGEPNETWPTPRFILLCERIIAPLGKIDPLRFEVYEL